MRLQVKMALAALVAVFAPAALMAADPQAQPQPPPPQSQPQQQPEVSKQQATAAEEAAQYTKDLDELQSQIGEVEKRTAEYRKEIDLLVDGKIDESRTTVRASYDKVIGDLEKERRKNRTDAIAKFEAFIQKYPNNPKYTPDAMFRLSELMFEKETDQYFTALDDYDRAMKDYRDGKIKVKPVEPVKNLEPVITIYRKLLSDFPDYKHTDLVLYVQGYALLDQGQGKEAAESFQTLVTKYPKSKLVIESWLRIGEYYFDQEPIDFNATIDAYMHAMADPGHPWYDKALYKLAWTYYRKDDLANAVKYFTDLLEYYQKNTKKDEKAAGEMRPEAIKYIAVCFSDDTWPGAGVDNLKKYYASLGNPPYTYEVFKSYADTLYTADGLMLNGRSNYQNAIDVYKELMRLEPENPKNPEIEARIIDAYAYRENDPEAAAEERQVFLTTYKEGSPWRAANKENTEAIAQADELTEKLLYTAAIYHYQKASALKENNKLEEALKQYKTAAASLSDYLKLFPRSKLAYELSYLYAECLYWSFQFAAAAPMYEKVRDSTAGDKYQLDAALSAVVARENLVKQLVADGKLEPLKLIFAKDRKEGEPIVAKEIDAERKALIADYDYFVKKYPTNEKSANSAYPAALIIYEHNQFDEARKRFAEIIDNYKGTDQAKDSANLIVESYLLFSDWEKVAEWSERIQQKGFADKAFNVGMGKMEAGALYKKADKLDKDGKFEEAAAEYVKLVNKKPDNEFADRALYNAALAYEKLRKFDSAAKVYDRIYTEYPNSTFASIALMKVAINLEKAYKFEEANNKYLLLVDKYPESENRASALFNAALNLDNLQRYQESIEKYQKFMREYPKHERVPGVAFTIINIAEKQKDWNSVIKYSEQFIKQYGNDPKQSGRIVEAYFKIADAYENLGNKRMTMQSYDNVLKEYQRRGLGPNTVAANYAAKAKFLKAEEVFAKYETQKIGGNARKLKQQLEEKARGYQDVRKAYAEVYPYKQTEWTIAALYRIANGKQRFAEALFDAPVPPELKTDEEKDMYRMQLEDLAAPSLDEAVSLYAAAQKVAIDKKVTNRWTKLINESLYKLRPLQYPMQKDAKWLFQKDPIPEGSLDMMDKIPMTPPGQMVSGTPPQMVAPPQAPAPAPQPAEQAPKPPAAPQPAGGGEEEKLKE